MGCYRYKLFAMAKLIFILEFLLYHVYSFWKFFLQTLSLITKNLYKGYLWVLTIHHLTIWYFAGTDKIFFREYTYMSVLIIYIFLIWHVWHTHKRFSDLDTNIQWPPAKILVDFYIFKNPVRCLFPLCTLIPPLFALLLTKIRWIFTKNSIHSIVQYCF